MHVLYLRLGSYTVISVQEIRVIQAENKQGIHRHNYAVYYTKIG